MHQLNGRRGGRDVEREVHPRRSVSKVLAAFVRKRYHDLMTAESPSFSPATNTTSPSAGGGSRSHFAVPWLRHRGRRARPAARRRDPFNEAYLATKRAKLGHFED